MNNDYHSVFAEKLLNKFYNRKNMIKSPDIHSPGLILRITGLLPSGNKGKVKRVFLIFFL